MRYPYIMAVGVATTAIVVWWFRGFQLKIFKARLKLASETKDEVVRQFNDLKAAVAAGAGVDALTARIEKLEAAVHSALTGTLNATEGADIGGAVE
jgi:hypothetical protein